jgi:hypothetical protein
MASLCGLIPLDSDPGRGERNAENENKPRRSQAV